MKLLIIRHAQPEDETLTGGVGDPPLSALGKQQSELLARYLQTQPITAVYSSPLVRSTQTAEPYLQATSHELITRDFLIEAGHDGSPYERSEENLEDHVRKLTKNPDHFFLPEGRLLFSHRIMTGLWEIVEANKPTDQTPKPLVAVFCHGMVTNAICQAALEIHAGPFDLHASYTGITRLSRPTAHRKLLLTSFNETQHLQELK